MDKAMRRCYFLFLALALTPTVQAQLWCPPSAAWTANLFGLAVDGCENAVYFGDTIYQGRTAQHIAVEDIVMNYMSPPQDTVHWDMYTSVQDSVVFQWTDSQGWDTLYWFNAVPGSRWYPPGLPITQSELCNALEVTDTAQVYINGLSLRQLTCAFLDQFGNITSNIFTITERFGTGSMHFPAGACVTDEPAWMPHTYVDNAFPLYDNGAGSYCDHFSGVAERVARLNAMAFPNPGTDKLHIATTGNLMSEVTVTDAMGRCMAYLFSDSSTLELNAEDWISGLYLVRITSAGETRVLKWVKQ